MELETICRYHLPVVVVVFNNGGVYKRRRRQHRFRGSVADDADASARHDRLIEAFGGTGYQATTPAELTAALAERAGQRACRRLSTASSTRRPAPKAAT